MMMLLIWLEAVVAIAIALAAPLGIFWFFPYFQEISPLVPNAFVYFGFVYVGFYMVKCGIAYWLHGKKNGPPSSTYWSCSCSWL